jgi:Flp pilus assembly protein CpaB
VLQRLFPTFFAPATALKWQDFLARYRRLLIAALSVLLVLASVSAIRGSRPTTTVVVATHALRAGQVLRADDIIERTVPTAAGLGAAARVSDIAGRTLLVDLNIDQPLFEAFTLNSGTIPAGTAAVPLRPADAAVATVVRAGEHVDVIGQHTSDDIPTVIARNLAVLTITTPPTTGLLKSATEAPMVVVVADPSTAAALAAATLAGPIALTLRD